MRPQPPIDMHRATMAGHEISEKKKEEEYSYEEKEENSREKNTRSRTKSELG